MRIQKKTVTSRKTIISVLSKTAHKASMTRILIILLFIAASLPMLGQEKNTIIRGKVSDTSGNPLELVNIGVKGLNAGTFTGVTGSYELDVPANGKKYTLVFSRIGFLSREQIFTADPDSLTINIIMEPDITRLEDVIVRRYTQKEAPTLRVIPVKDINLLPSVSGSVEQLLVSMPGVNSRNELSNQYNVRGGNYDENLVYVNDIQVYHPVLIKSGQQEGLSFINPDLIGNIRFSAGGFNASFGDRMSSVLDLRYREPSETGGSLKTGLLLNSAHVETVSGNGKLKFISGARYKSTRLLLQTLDTKGNYSPDFFDIQSMLSYDISEQLKVSILGNYNSNKFSFTPESRRSSFGNLSEAYQLYVLYEGSETDSYNSYNLAFSLDYESDYGMNHKFIAHHYKASESETYDIRAYYSLNLLDQNLGSENLGDSLMNVGTGSWLNHARNMLEMNNYTVNYKGRWEHSNNILGWGLKYNIETSGDRIREWEKIDSAGYSVPYSPAELTLSSSTINDTAITTNKLEAFIIDNFTINAGGHSLVFTGGARITHWSFSNELLFSPRLSLAWHTASGNSRYFISGGIYYQPPYYREMRYPSGDINPGIKSQRSEHIVLGTEQDLVIGNTPFRFTGEMYYKNLENVIPYKYDNVRIIYAAENIAVGFVRGVDLRLNGEFVADAESWISLSLMDARHDIVGDDHGYYPAPSDTRFSANIFFQDYFPSYPSYRAHINIHFSTGIPVSSPFTDRYDSYRRMPSYRRVDIGFTKIFKSEYYLGNSGFLSFFDEIIAGVEIFNLLDIRNTISYNWLTTVNNLSNESRQYAVPNYLTGRSVNFKLMLSF